MKGESLLHKLCRKSSSTVSNNNVNSNNSSTSKESSTTSRQEVSNSAMGLQLDRYLKDRHHPVNPRDNFGNTPLHDAVANDRFDALAKFYEYCSDRK
jgi:ankyrin repeat protein